MKAYYNENDAFCVQWLKNLIAENLIAPGDVDDRDIRDVRPVDLRGYTQCHFFAGIGGWSCALRLAGVGDHEVVWTGSCPCQPFSAAGKRGGFADERHLWPSFYHLITQCRPPVLYGEQVASAAEWLRLVRGDLEALDYAVGCCPVEAASAGADHLRDRFWFVADHEHAREGWRGIHRPNEGAGPLAIGTPDQFAGSSPNSRLVVNNPGIGWGEGRPQHAIWSGGNPAPGSSGVGLADADNARSQGRSVLSERDGERIAGANGVAYSDFSFGRIGDQQPAGQLAQQQPDPGSRYSWVIGADGKARRVKSGVRLLVNGFPNRVGLLRGFGNAIDPRPAAAFIQATR